MTEEDQTAPSNDHQREGVVGQYDALHNELLIGGASAHELLSQSEGRPVYAYDGAVITRSVRSVTSLLPPQVKLHYAVKANPMPACVNHIAGLGIGLDVASATELATARTTGVSRSDISFAGPGKSLDDIRAGVDAGCVMVVESQTEALRIASQARETGKRVPCAIRVNPNFSLIASGMKMGGGPQQFGVDEEQVPALLERLKGEPLDLIGFHIFTGSQNLNTQAIIDGQRKVLELAESLALCLEEGLRWLNIGGGLGVPYFPGDQPLDLPAVMEALNGALSERSGTLGDTEVVMELGRYLVASAGVYLCSVTDKKVSRGTTFLITNGGLHHHLAATGNFGQVIRRNYPVAVANRLQSEDREIVTIVGPLCTPLDLLGKDLDLPTADVGDIIGIFMSGAYGYTASPHGFLSHPEALEIFL